MTASCSQLPVVLLPCQDPGPGLVDLVRQLIQHPDVGAVVVVDDGSGEACADVLGQIQALAGTTLLRHHVTVGRGAALKTGLHRIGTGFPHAVGAILVETNGHHHLDDIIAVARTLLANPQRLIMGCRAPPASQTLRSRIGGSLTRWVMRAMGGVKVSDTQSGLRGIPRACLPYLLRLRTVGHDFELDMLLAARQQGLGIIEIPIRSLPGLEHVRRFNPARDSLRIYYVFLRFNLSSLSAFMVDYSLFALLHLAGTSLAFSQFGARAVSSLFNYLVNRHFVFKADQARWGSLLLYYATVVLVAACSYGLILLMHETLGMSVYLAKLIADSGLYIASFAIQREFVFRRRADEEMTG